MPWLDFKVVRKLCTIQELLDRYGVELRGRGDVLRGKCPLPTHSSNNSADSFSATLSKNLWSCKSASCIHNSGKKGGNVLDFVMVMEQCSIRDAAEKIVEWFGQEEGQKEKAPHMAGPDGSHGDIPTSQSNGNKSNGNGKLRYMQQIDEWFDCVIRRGDQEEDEETYYHRIRNAIKTKLIESYRAGKQAVQPQT